MNESSSVVLMCVKGTNVIGRFKATAAAVDSRISRSWDSVGHKKETAAAHRTHEEVPAVGTGAGRARGCRERDQGGGVQVRGVHREVLEVLHSVTMSVAKGRQEHDEHAGARM